MSTGIALSWESCRLLAKQAVLTVLQNRPVASVYGVPRGGCIPAVLSGFTITEQPDEADVIIDDIIDSGRTQLKWRTRFPAKPFVALIDKLNPQDPFAKAGWISFPWEHAPDQEATDHVVRILEHIGEDPHREGLRGTPERVVKSWLKLFGGYRQDPQAVLGTQFEGESYDQMVVLDNIEFFSTCEHHMQPFFGRAHVAYIPNKRVVGISKLARVVEVFARRLQIQERLTTQIAQAIEKALDPRGVGVVLEGQHFCMVCRGVEKQNSVMRTSTLLGAFRETQVRAEFLTLIARNGGHS